MHTFLTILLHAVLLTTMVLFVGTAVVAIRDTKNRSERALRALAAFCGAMIVLGAQAAGLTFPEFIVRSLSGSTTMGHGAVILGAVIPSALGVAVGMMFQIGFKRDENRALRGLALIGTLAAVQFAQIYAVAVDTSGLHLGPAAVPNISFVVGIALYLVFKVDSAPDGRPERSKIATLVHRLTTRDGASGHRATGAGSGHITAPGAAPWTGSGPAGRDHGEDDGLVDLRRPPR